MLETRNRSLGGQINPTRQSGPPELLSLTLSKSPLITPPQVGAVLETQASSYFLKTYLADMMSHIIVYMKIALVQWGSVCSPTKPTLPEKIMFSYASPAFHPNVLACTSKAESTQGQPASLFTCTQEATMHSKLQDRFCVMLPSSPSPSPSASYGLGRPGCVGDEPGIMAAAERGSWASFVAQLVYHPSGTSGFLRHHFP